MQPRPASVVPAVAGLLIRLKDGCSVKVAGTVIVRQRPGSARGFLFISLEDETGISNIIVHPELFEKHRMMLVGTSFLLVEGTLQFQENVLSIRAREFRALPGFQMAVSSHDFG